MVKGFIFDMDGLMLDTEKLYIRFWCEAARFYGYPMEEWHALSIRSMAAKYAIERLKGYFGEDFDYHKVRQKRMELMNVYIEEFGMDLKPGIVEILSYLREKNYKIGVATATDMERTTRYLKKLNLYEYFDEIVVAAMVENGKPAPDIYKLAAERLGLMPEECMALEDSPNGIHAAYHAGCKPVMVPDLDQPDETTKKMLFACKENLLQVLDMVKAMEE